MLTSLFVLCAVVCMTTAFPDGAPLSSCGDMFPAGHYVPAQTSTPPYTINVVDDGNGLYTVSVTGTQIYKGAFVQARNIADTTPLGTFENFDVEFLKTIDCPGGSANAITHTTNIDKTDMTFTFNGQGLDLTDVRLVATICEDMTTFWVNVESAPLL